MITCTQGERQSQMILRVVQDVASNTLNIVYIGTLPCIVYRMRAELSLASLIMLSFAFKGRAPKSHVYKEI